MKKLVLMTMGGMLVILTGCSSPRAGLNIAQTVANGLFATADSVITQMEMVRTNTISSVKSVIPAKKTTK